ADVKLLGGAGMVSQLAFDGGQFGADVENRLYGSGIATSRLACRREQLITPATDLCDEPLTTLTTKNVSHFLLQCFQDADAPSYVRLQHQRLGLFNPEHPKDAFMFVLVVFADALRQRNTEQAAQFLLGSRPVESASRCNELCLGPLAIRFE